MHIFVTYCAVQVIIAKWRNQTQNEEEFLSASTDAAFQNALDCYLQAAPQEIVQIAVIFSETDNFTRLSMSRISSVGGVIAFRPRLTGVVIVVHWIVATFWVWWKTEPQAFCNRSKVWHVPLCMVFGVIYFFKPVNLENGPTRSHYICYYTIIFLQNVVASVVICFLSVNNNVHIGVFNVVTFIFGIFCYMIYYQKFHPMF
ncbi:XK-related protein 4-like, partial [Asbolus verrucosus]